MLVFLNLPRQIPLAVFELYAGNFVPLEDLNGPALCPVAAQFIHLILGFLHERIFEIYPHIS